MNMEGWITICEIVLPALMVGGIAIFIVHKYIEYEEVRVTSEIEKSRLEIIFPLRMQAYERIVLFLERSLPENLIRRGLKGGMSARKMQQELIAMVRGEYEHNITQQVYVSRISWDMVKTSMEETVRLINVAGAKLHAEASATDLGEKILFITSQINKFPTHIALEHVKKEFAHYFIEYTEPHKK